MMNHTLPDDSPAEAARIIDGYARDALGRLTPGKCSRPLSVASALVRVLSELDPTYYGGERASDPVVRERVARLMPTGGPLCALTFQADARAWLYSTLSAYAHFAHTLRRANGAPTHVSDLQQGAARMILLMLREGAVPLWAQLDYPHPATTALHTKGLDLDVPTYGWGDPIPTSARCLDHPLTATEAAALAVAHRVENIMPGWVHKPTNLPCTHPAHPAGGNAADSVMARELATAWDGVTARAANVGRSRS